MTTRGHATRTTPIAAPRDDLCLAFANTLSWRGIAMPSESLGGTGDLLGWLAGTANLPVESIDSAGDWLGRHPKRSAALFAEAIALREAIYRIFGALAAAEPIADRDIALLNRVLAEAPRRETLAQADDGYAWDIKKIDVSVPGLLAPVLWSAADLLTRADRRRVRRCANDACLWLFIDDSKAGTRRWCDMSACGNRAKSRRHYLKTKLG